MIEVSIIIKDFLILVDGLDGVNNPISSIVGSGCVCCTGVVGQTNAGINCSSKFNILTVDEAMASPDELVDLIRVTGAGLNMFSDNGGYSDNFWIGQLFCRL